MELLDGRRTLKRAGDSLQKAARVLAIVEELENPDVVGRLRLPAGEDVPAKTILAFVSHCRRAEPGQDITLVALGPRALSDPNSQEETDGTNS